MSKGRPQSRSLHLTLDHLERATRSVYDVAAQSTFTRATDEDYAALVERLVAERSDDPLYSFAYGSLIWNQCCRLSDLRLWAQSGHRIVSLRDEVLLSYTSVCQGVFCQVADTSCTNRKFATQQVMAG